MKPSETLKVTSLIEELDRLLSNKKSAKVDINSLEFNVIACGEKFYSKTKIFSIESDLLIDALFKALEEQINDVVSQLKELGVSIELEETEEK